MKSKDCIKELFEKTGIIGYAKMIQEKIFCGRKSFSQSGEDLIVDHICQSLNIDYENFSYIDVGANHYKKNSNTYYFYKKGAKGILVEANPSLARMLEKERPRDKIVNVAIGPRSGETLDFYIFNAHTMSTISSENRDEIIEKDARLHVKEVVKIQTLSLEDVLSQYTDTAPTMLSIDIEGMDYMALQTLSFEQARPLIVIVENGEYSPLVRCNEKDVEIMTYMEKNGYKEYAYTGINSIFIDKRVIGEN